MKNIACGYTPPEALHRHQHWGEQLTSWSRVGVSLLLALKVDWGPNTIRPLRMPEAMASGGYRQAGRQDNG